MVARTTILAIFTPPVTEGSMGPNTSVVARLGEGTSKTARFPWQIVILTAPNSLSSLCSIARWPIPRPQRANSLVLPSPHRSRHAEDMVSLLTKLKPKRRWMQFSIGTMLIGLTTLCVWLASQVGQARRQRDAITELHKFHVAVLYREPDAGQPLDGGGGQELLGLTFREPVDYVGFQHAHRLFADPQARATALSLLQHLRGLKRVSLEGMPVTDKELMSLTGLTGLRKLNLMYTEVTDAGVAELHQALPHCEIMR